MKFTESTNINRVEEEDESKYVEKALNNIAAILNNGIVFTDNFDAKILTITFSAANADVASLHGLGRVPSGYVQIGQSTATTVYDGSTANSASLLYLRASATGVCKVMVF